MSSARYRRRRNPGRTPVNNAPLRPATKISIVGVGPGTENLITQEAAFALSSADILVGSGRMLEALETFESTAKTARRIELPVSGMANAVIGALEEAMTSEPGADVALVVSGDPGFYSLSRKVTRHFGRERVRAIPGISSLQLMACRLGRSWAGVSTATLHGREMPDRGALAEKLKTSDALAVLLGASDDAVAQMRLLSEDPTLGEAWAAVGWDLGLPKEQVCEAQTLRELIRCPYVGWLAILWLSRGDDQ